jgi:hypothetical protein
MNINKRTVAKLIVFKLGAEPELAEIVADEMIADDFPLNKIKTMGQVIAYLDYVRELKLGKAPA